MARRDERGGKERFWRGMVARWRRTRGQSTIRGFCDEHGLSEQSFYAWRRTITKRDQQSAREDELPAFVPLRVAPTAVPTSAGLEVVVGPDQIVRVPPDFDAATLRRLLAVLREAPSC
jgi:transposase-like protein